VTIRGMTLHELKAGSAWRLMSKESLLGLLNGGIVGLVAGAGMFLLAKSQGNPQALPLALIVVAAMTGSCVVSGLFGAIVPIALKRLGADPATASSIFLTTATDVASMGLLLSLATVFLL
ncbi:MAG TPA: magnesium transporter, partial [Elusimicrobiales bacterium]|nr:magnesium transporter [Elusimicrobiales bacterium]